jgi:multiple antibiotic resistance protein
MGVGPIMTLYSITLSLFLLMDSIGNVPIFISFLKDISPKRQRIVIFRELLIALFFMILFLFLGDSLLSALGVSQQVVMISGGIILFLIALKMIFPPPKDPNQGISPTKEPFIVPLAIPLLAGPAVLASIMLYGSQEEIGTWTLIGAIILAWIPSAIILLASSWLQRLLGPRALMACERLMGLILTLIAVQMFLEGLKSYFR